ncbi:uncharacterized protein LOC121047998, partial [Ixodes scapularis]|uniref:uncharacterized protein LOC121047998 n=1 Tax=Ixodes scapularis TaxID=6945 RepID=UPI001C392286
HGNSAVASSANMHPITFTQVGDRKYGFRSDYVALVVLPCPRVLVQCVYDCLSVTGMLLKLSGDVEENPGPITEKMFFEMLQTQKEILKKVNEIQVKQDTSEINIQKLQNRLDTIEEKLQMVDETSGRLGQIETRLTGHDHEITSLYKQVDDLENRSRRNNLIIRGISEAAPETEEVLVRSVTHEVFDGILKVKVDSIERIHRLGRQIPGRIRPVIVKFADFRDKMKILNNCSKLKGTQISINEDFSKRVVEIRKHLWNSTADERKEGAKARLVFDKVKINNVLYAWDEVRNER